MTMNLPNKLTMARVVCIPIFIIAFIIGVRNNNLINIINGYSIDLFRLIATIIFILASITDYFDGKIAREQNLVTNFGKLMDPLADKMLVVTALMLLSANNEINYICTLIVVLRELAISSIRLIALEQNIVIAASKWGKIKTATQMIAIVLILFCDCRINNNIILNNIINIIFYISMLFVVISLIDYIIKSKEVFIK